MRPVTLRRVRTESEPLPQPGGTVDPEDMVIESSLRVETVELESAHEPTSPPVRGEEGRVRNMSVRHELGQLRESFSELFGLRGGQAAWRVEGWRWLRNVSEQGE